MRQGYIQYEFTCRGYIFRIYTMQFFFVFDMRYNISNLIYKIYTSYLFSHVWDVQDFLCI